MKPKLLSDEQGSYLLFPEADQNGKDRILRINFLEDDKYRRPLRGGQELIAKALGEPKSLVYDLTLGLAEDAWTMLRLGFRVLGVERESELATLLIEAQAKAAVHERWGPMASKLQVRHAEAATILSEIRDGKLEAPDVIYMDPMFSGVAKKSALPRLEMQLLRGWLGENEDGESLLTQARAVAKKRVVVKRLAKAEAISLPVTHSFKGEKVRYDMYLTNNLSK